MTHSVLPWIAVHEIAPNHRMTIGNSDSKQEQVLILPLLTLLIMLNYSMIELAISVDDI